MVKKNELKDILKYHNDKDYLLAKKKYLKFIRNNKKNSDAYHLLGMLFHSFEDNYPKAVANLTQCIIYNPKNYEAYLNRGSIHLIKGKIDESIKDFTRAIELNNRYDLAYNNRGKAYSDLGHFEKSISDFDRAISFNPNYAEAYLGRANARKKIHDFDGAINDYEIAIMKKENFHEAYFDLSLLLLLLGNYKKGFSLFESRWNAKKLRFNIKNNTKKLWLGDEDLNGKRILLHCEQGIGDTIQFSRYVNEFKKYDCEVYFEVQKSLVDFISTINNKVKVYETGFFDEEYDYHCPVMSLPLAFKTTIDNIPKKYQYLKTDPEKVDKWEKILGKKTKPRIGLAWFGNPNNNEDKFRSTKIKNFANSLDEKYEWVSLHKEYKDNEKDELLNLGIRDFSDYQFDFSETAAQIENLDLVVSIDTSIAHCAGAIGKKTFIILPHTPDWRWLLKTEKTPWYPSVNLVRLEKKQDWQDIFSKLIKQIHNFL